MKDNAVVRKNSNKQHRFLESTCDFSKIKKTFLLFEEPSKDLNEIEWWEDHLDLLGVHRALIQVEKCYVDGTIKVLGYNIVTDQLVDAEIYRGA